MAEERRVLSAKLPFEFMMNALRLNEGFDTGLFQQRTGLPLGRIEPALAAAEAGGLLHREVGRIAPTLRGRRFLNELLQRFLT